MKSEINQGELVLVSKHSKRHLPGGAAHACPTNLKLITTKCKANAKLLYKMLKQCCISIKWWQEVWVSASVSTVF